MITDSPLTVTRYSEIFRVVELLDPAFNILSQSVRQGVLERRREHSRKPDCVYNRIEELLPGPYLEMFSCTDRDVWDALGNDTGRWQA